MLPQDQNASLNFEARNKYKQPEWENWSEEAKHVKDSHVI